MLIRFIVLLILFTACNPTKKESNTIRLYVLKGPTAIAFARLLATPTFIDGREMTVSIVDSPQQMQASVIKKEADIAVLPMINAVNLYNKDVRYALLGCPVWGTLYLAGHENPDSFDAQSLKGKCIHVFGTGSTPEILLKYYLQKEHIDPSLLTFNYSFPTAQETMQAMLGKKAAIAVLSEPFLSIAMRQDTSIHILANLNAPDESYIGFAQTAVVYSSAMNPFKAQLDSLFLSSCLFANNHPDQTINILEKKNIFAPGVLSPESIRRCKIQYRPAAEINKNIMDFLSIIYQYEPKAIGGKLPDSTFTGQ